MCVCVSECVCVCEGGCARVNVSVWLNLIGQILL